MSGWEIALVVFVTAAFVAAVGFLIFGKLSGKVGSCDCGGSCSGCPCGCKKKKKDKKSL